MTHFGATDWKTLAAGARVCQIQHFRVRSIRAGEGPAMVMLHGGGTWAYSFRHNIAPLARCFDIHAPDMPGHGHTRPTGKRPRYDLNVTCDFLRAYLDWFEIEKAFLVGHSWGGGWALHFAARHPDRVRKLVVMSSSGIPVRDHGIWELLKWPVIGRLLAGLATENTLRRGLAHAYYRPRRITREMVRSVYEPLRFSRNRSAQCQFAKHLDWSSVQADLARIHLPTLVIWGCFDQYLDVSCGRQMQALLPDAQLVVMDQCGHCPHEEFPGRVNRLIQKFCLEGRTTA